MQGKRSSTIGLFAAGLAVLALSGCLFGTQTIGSGDSARTWKGGKLSRTYPAGYDRVWNAASTSIHDMKLSVEEERHDALTGRIRARRADDIAVRLDVDNVGEKQTKVVIWVGAIGTDRDKQCAMTIMDAIDKKIGK